ncbi:MAG: hypothetical protein KDA45_15535, partial [Planctomycetales bacterium]|nr:hypothetical protein [Planctomycetales bacterium]
MVQHLLLVPTQIELHWVDARLPPAGDAHQVAVCGFGPLAAAARAAALIAQWQPESVLLLGIAGGLQPSVQIGTAYHFAQVACYGVGAGSGGDFQTVEEMGWQHWS